ncbi:MAG: carbonic anhydrase [Cyanobacteria bacterium REEB459]|nr:carbonic anhydrase [Cyanobacteria bacterium REEB459]
MVAQGAPLSLSRRSLLATSARVVGVGTLASWLGCLAAPMDGAAAIAAALTPDRADLTPSQALEKLLDGNQRFVHRQRQNPHQDLSRLSQVAQTQTPFAAILSCADSRVIPEIIFDQGIGDLFVVRGAGNLATRQGIASQEFGTLVLGARVLMVLGHSRCGAVKAALSGVALPGQIDSLVEAIKPAVDDSANQTGDRLDNAIKMNVQRQVKKLAMSPVLGRLVEQGQLQLVAGYYNLDTGKVSVLG